jgi:hypothetical protein
MAQKSQSTSHEASLPAADCLAQQHQEGHDSRSENDGVPILICTATDVADDMFPSNSPRPKLTMKAKRIGLGDIGPEAPIVLDKLPVFVGRNLDTDVHLDDRWISTK